MAIVVEHVAASDRLADSVGLLIENGTAKARVPATSVQDQVASGIHVRVVGARKAKTDACRVGTRGDDEVVLELPIVAVVHKIHSGVHVSILDPGIGRDVRTPAPRVVADEIVDLAGQLLLRYDLWLAATPDMVDAQHGLAL